MNFERGSISKYQKRGSVKRMAVIPLFSVVDFEIIMLMQFLLTEFKREGGAIMWFRQV